MTLSELLKICQKLQYREKGSSKQIKYKHSALSFYPSSVDHRCPDMSNWIETSEKCRKENIFQTILLLNTKSVDCVRTIVDVVWPCSSVEPQKAREK